MDNRTKDVVIERTFNAKIESVWKMWTDGDSFKQWYGPEGASIPVAEMDLSVGGKRRVGMEVNTPNGPMTMWFGGEFKEISPVTRLVYSEVMTDENGTAMPPSAMGMPGDEPEITTVTVELVDQGESTKMTMTHTGVPAGSPGEMGWNMAIDKLEKTFS